MKTVVRFAATAWFVIGSLCIFLDSAGMPCTDTTPSLGVMCLLAVVITISYITDRGGSKDDQPCRPVNQI